MGHRMRPLKQYLPCLALTLLVAIAGEPCRAQNSADVAKVIHAPPAELLNRPPHSPTPVRVLSVSGAAGRESKFLLMQCHPED